MASARRTVPAAGLVALVLGLSATALAASPDSGISGRVLLGPTCPVQRVGQSCVRAYQTTVAIYTVSGHRLVDTFRSGSAGRFRVRLAPGRYSLQGTGAGYPRARPTAVTVRRHLFTTITITFDTGIR